MAKKKKRLVRKKLPKKKKKSRRTKPAPEKSWEEKALDIAESIVAPGMTTRALRDEIVALVTETLTEVCEETDRVKAELREEREKPPIMIEHSLGPPTSAVMRRKLDVAMQFFDNSVHHEVQVREHQTPIYSSSGLGSHVRGHLEYELNIVSRLNEQQMRDLEGEFRLGGRSPF